MNSQRPIKTRMGIVGIERNIEEKNRATDNSISQAFQDMQVLMSKVLAYYLPTFSFKQ